MRFPRMHRGSLAVTAAIAAIALTAAGCGGDDKPSSSGTGLEKTTLNVGILQVADVAQLQLALDRGFFTAEGLTVKTQVLQGGAEAVPKLRSKNLDVSFGAWVPAFLAQASGAFKMHAVAPAFDSDTGTHVVLVPKDSPIKTAKDLAGKKIGINVKHNLGSLLMQAQLQPLGVKLDDEKNFVAMPFPNMLAALKSGSVDAVQAVEPFHTQIQQAIGARKVLELSQGETANFPIAGYFSTDEFAKDNPKTLAAFQRAVGKAQALLSDTSLLAQVVPKFSRTPAETVATMHKGKYPTTLDAASLKRVSDLMVKYGYLKSPIDVNALVGNG
ncbi:MAG TPA: ABC transporter substrate-binding protein [Streptosporangiaceae bacterium]|nr:ABC transporter substrate-binding protein [Streptosporangiaceae bacterium]